MMPGLLLLMVEMLVELVLLPVSLLLLWMLAASTDQNSLCSKHPC